MVPPTAAGNVEPGASIRTGVPVSGIGEAPLPRGYRVGGERSERSSPAGTVPIQLRSISSYSS